MEDWEDEPIPDLLKKKEPLKANWDDEDIDDVKESWEDEDGPATAPKVESAPSEKAPKKAAAKSGDKKMKATEAVKDSPKEEPLDPVQEKLRQQRKLKWIRCSLGYKGSDTQVSEEKRGASPAQDDRDTKKIKLESESQAEQPSFVVPIITQLKAPLTREQLRYLAGDLDKEDDGTKFYGESFVYDTSCPRDMTSAEQALIEAGYEKGSDAYMAPYKTRDNIEIPEKVHVEALLNEDGDFTLADVCACG
ncbi:Translation initiation factor eIF3 subunit [Striga hermonthica]|uniref:Translation initiation factor eIF3 subunit n=1 Tax=Striga hermonthica TaxID=68872 RepID=A0A9N7MMI2_STRHE|nr:Translation initiation factor eIF3 subunit [Striga hermonthica]